MQPQVKPVTQTAVILVCRAAKGSKQMRQHLLSMEELAVL